MVYHQGRQNRDSASWTQLRVVFTEEANYLEEKWGINPWKITSLSTSLSLFWNCMTGRQNTLAINVVHIQQKQKNGLLRSTKLTYKKKLHVLSKVKTALEMSLDEQWYFSFPILNKVITVASNQQKWWSTGELTDCYLFDRGKSTTPLSSLTFPLMPQHFISSLTTDRRWAMTVNCITGICECARVCVWVCVL